MSERQFKGIWIPVEVLELDIPMTCKMLWGDIHSFSNRDGSAYFKSNERIAETYHVSQRSASRAIKLLEEMGLINVIRQNRQRYCTATLDNLSNLPRQKEHPILDKMSTQPRQNVYPAETNCLHSITIENTSKKTFENKEVVMPFDSDEFLEMWETWKQERKDRKLKNFTPRGEQAALHDLHKMSKGNHDTAIKIIQQSLAKGWQGLYELKSTGRNIELDPVATLKWATQ
jgi:DNA-binding transcriptional ArsR family regulator